ncbi:MAG: family 78 glycoside hydrolase catalytic domain, partial [Eubacteriales bacterium]
MIEVRELYLDGGRLFSDARFCITDNKNPTFSWSCVSDTDGDYQTAYQITVACGKNRLWFSGWTESREQSAKYAGKHLPAGRCLDFSVRVRNSRGEESDAFGGQFVCGAMTQDAWKGQWISSDADNGQRAIYFRRDFRIDRELESACLFVSGIGYHKVTINGTEADDAELDPAFSDYNKTCYYAVLPYVGELLENGDNCIGIIVANGWRNNPDETITMANGGKPSALFGKPALNAQLMLFYRDGTKQCLCTDERWKWKFGAVTEAHIFNGETYDANESDPLWDQPLDEGERAAAADTYHDVSVDCGPGGVLRPMALEPIRMRETYTPLTMTEPVRGTYIVDFGQNMAGTARVLLPTRMKRGQVVEVRFSEELTEDGFLFTDPLRSAKQTDTYIASGDDRDLTVWQPHFTYHGFRYAEIKGIPLFDRHNILAVAEYNDIKNESFFRCGSAVVNAIQDLVIKTEKSNLHSILTDCPQRNERMAWMNDAT